MLIPGPLSTPGSSTSGWERPRLSNEEASPMQCQPEFDCTPTRFDMDIRLAFQGCWLALLLVCASSVGAEWPANRWIELRRDDREARRGSAIRYVPDAHAFFLWGFFDDDPELPQEHPLMEVPEYDMVMFNPDLGRWTNHLPKEWQAAWSKKLPLAYIPRTYAAITTGSERTLLRGPTDEPEGAPRPDLNIVFDQFTYDPSRQALVYFTGGLTAAYDVSRGRWTDLAPPHRPPPVLGGSLAYDPSHRQIILFGGGHVAERGPGGKVVGYTGTWVFRGNDWHRLDLRVEPPPRMNTRLVCDTKNQVMVLFGGDSQHEYLADTWLFDLKTETWRRANPPGAPAPRAGHFTVYDPEAGWVIIGGGYNRQDLTDMWVFDAAQDRWQKLIGEVPTGFCISADYAPDQGLILLVTDTRKPGDTMTCNVLYPVRTTYIFRFEKETVLAPESTPQPPQPMLKHASANDTKTARAPAGTAKLSELPVNQWTELGRSNRTAPLRTWGSASFDTGRSRILYWGGGHCGYEANDVDAFDVASQAWQSLGLAESPERLWDLGVRLAGVTFEGAPWTEHGRRIYAYDPVSRKLIMVRTIRLTTGYDPPLFAGFPADRSVAMDTLLNPPSSYARYTTWSFDLATGRWELLGGAPLGLDTLVTTRHGVMGVNVRWPSRLNDAGYLIPYRPSQPARDTAIYLFDAAQSRWRRVDTPQPSPQNLYEMTSLAYDSKRDRVILHGGGENRDELWAFELRTRRWRNLQPKVLDPPGGAPPTCAREAVYLPNHDVVLAFGRVRHSSSKLALFVYRADDNSWAPLNTPMPPGVSLGEYNENRAMVYDAKHDVVLLVLGEGGDVGRAVVYGVRYQPEPGKQGNRGEK